MRKKRQVSFGSFVTLVLNTQILHASVWISAIKANYLPFWDSYQKGAATEEKVIWLLREIVLFQGGENLVEEILQKARSCGLSRAEITREIYAPSADSA